MALTFVKSAANSADGSATTMTVQLATVTAGNLIAVCVEHEGSATTSSVSDGTSTLTAKTLKSHSNDDLHCRWFYILSSVANGTVTYTVTLGAARLFKRMHAYEFSYSGTAQFDTEPSGGGGAGTSAAPSSGNMTTTGTDEVVLAVVKEYGETFSSPLINAVAADGSQSNPPSADISWYKIFTGTFTGAATCTASGSIEWVVAAIAFNTGGGGGSTQPPRSMHQFRMGAA